MLILPASTSLTPEAAGALARAGDVAAVIAGGMDAMPSAAYLQHLHGLADPIQEAGAAFLLDGWPAHAPTLALDGAHLTGFPAVKAALSRLKPDRIVGAGGLTTRHDAMEAGESGADYVLFGDAGLPFPQVLDLVSWWVDLFEVPCVGVARDREEALALAQAGADFVALAGDWLLEPEAPEVIAGIDAAIRQAGTAP